MAVFRDYDQSQNVFRAIHPPALLEEEHPARVIDRVVELWIWSGCTRSTRMRAQLPDAFLARNADALAAWFDAYTRTFVERDLAALGVRVSSSTMRRMWTMLAHLNGGLWNASHLGNALGVNYQTVNRYLDILEQAFLVRRLPPYHANIGKRLVKSPKILFCDTGLLHAFLNIQDERTLDVHPARGAGWEAFVVDQLVSLVRLNDPRAQFYHWRTAGGAEVDLLIESGARLTPIEIKLHSAPGRSLVRGLRSCMVDLSIDRGYVVYPGKERYSLGDGISAVPALDLLSSPEPIASL